MRKHRVLALVTDAFGGYGGIAQYNRDFLSALSGSKSIESIEVFPRIASENFGALPAKVTQHAPLANKYQYALNLMPAIRRIKPTIVFSGHLFHGQLASVVASMSGAKLISQLHGTEIWDKVHRKHLQPLEKSDIVLCVSRDTRAKVLSKASSVPERVVVINNTFGEVFAPGDRVAARAKFDLSPDEFVILTVSRLDGRQGYKGHDRIIPLIPLLVAKGSNIVYLIAGVGEDRPRLECLAKMHGVADLVRFLGKVPAEDLPDLYRASDLFALPSTGEGFGIAFLEAMASGTPAIGLSVGGSTDALGDGHWGRCVEAKDFPQAFLEMAQISKRLEPSVVSDLRSSFGSRAFAQRIDQMLATL